MTHATKNPQPSGESPVRVVSGGLVLARIGFALMLPLVWVVDLICRPIGDAWNYGVAEGCKTFRKNTVWAHAEWWRAVRTGRRYK